MALLSPQSALIYTMVVVSAADARMGDKELHAIGEIVKTLPAFKGFDTRKLVGVASECATVLADDEGLDAVIGMIVEALTASQRETAYALAFDIAFSDNPVSPEESRIIQRLRDAFKLDRLTAAAIERTMQARYRAA
jgi:tellurite resistance protein